MTTRRAGIAIAIVAVCAMATAAAAEDLEYPHGAYEGECETCHTSDGWRPVTVPPEFLDEHPFPLRDAHALEDCTACHATLAFREAPSACVDCHLDPHRGELGIDCENCHVPRTFIDRTRMLRSHQSTRFPLRGSHRALDCEDCHALQPQGALRWVNLPTACFDCHRQAYPAGHGPAGFSTAYDECHVPTVWERVRFNHTGIVDGCINCHQDDYDNARDPDHRVVGYPTTCENCHSTRSWDDGDANHEAIFPLESGRHAGRWDSCSTCHTNPGNYSEFTCFGCHPHSDREKTDGDHRDEGGYSYDSLRCYACHPRGEAED